MGVLRNAIMKTLLLCLAVLVLVTISPLLCPTLPPGPMQPGHFPTLVGLLLTLPGHCHTLDGLPHMPEDKKAADKIGKISTLKESFISLYDFSASFEMNCSGCTFCFNHFPFHG